MTLILDSSGLTFLATPSLASDARQARYKADGLWPPVVHTAILIESLQEAPGRDANVNRFLKQCLIEHDLPEHGARRAAELRRRAGRGSAVDALVVALAEPGGTVLTGDRHDLEAIAAYSTDVFIEVILVDVVQPLSG